MGSEMCIRDRYYNEYVGMALSEEGLRCMALNRGAELPARSTQGPPLYEQTRLKN